MRPRGRPRKHPVSAESTPQEPVRKRPRDVRDMNRVELEDYALEIGLQKRALLLTDDRLRQNIMAFLQELYENAA
jgi:hypothetical protein